MHTVKLWCEQLLRKVMHTIEQNNSINTEQEMIDRSSTVTYMSGTLTALWGFVTSQEFGIFAGVLIGLLGLAVNVYYKQKDERRKQEIHALQLKGTETEE